MLGRVVVENGVKKIVPLTADCGSGNPVGTVIAVYSNKVPNGYLPCNGVAFDTAQFPVLYALLGDDHTPDLRECTLKGIGESGRTVGAHVKAGGLAVGEFVDDRIQEHSHSIRTSPVTSSGSSTGYTYASGDLATTGNATEARTGATTEVKAVGVNWCIKATSGINENQADNVLSALSPVDEVTLNNVHSVTSNAVAETFEWELISSDDVTFTIDTAGSSSTAFTPVYRHIYKCRNLIKMALAVTTTEAIPAPVGNGNMRFYVQVKGIVPANNLSTISTLAYVNDAVVPITVAYSSSITPNGWRVTFRYNDALNSGSTFGFYAVMAI